MLFSAELRAEKGTDKMHGIIHVSYGDETQAKRWKVILECFHPAWTIIVDENKSVLLINVLGSCQTVHELKAFMKKIDQAMIELMPHYRLYQRLDQRIDNYKRLTLALRETVERQATVIRKLEQLHHMGRYA